MTTSAPDLVWRAAGSPPPPRPLERSGQPYRRAHPDPGVGREAEIHVREPPPRADMGGARSSRPAGHRNPEDGAAIINAAGAELRRWGQKEAH